MAIDPIPSPDREAETPGTSLDPEDWVAFGATAHRVLDEALAHLRDLREKPVWRPVPAARRGCHGPPPAEGDDVARIAEQALTEILPHATGNVHPRFFGWVHGSGTATGIVAEIIAAAMNANVGGRDHAAVHVERQVIDWCRQLFGLPEGASGLLVSGTSMATLIGLTVARNHHASGDVRREGMAARAGQLVGYTSTAAHGSVAKAFEILGLGRDALRSIPVDACFRLDLAELRRAVARDRAEGRRPFCVIATAGTVDTGAIDDLQGVAGICAELGLWFHVDGAFGALVRLSDRLAPLLAGIERADSLAFDFHKWMHVPYDAGCLLVRQGDLHRDAFSLQTSYLAPSRRGLAGGEPWFCEFGPELSRGFRALKVWFTFKQFGTRRLGAAIETNCRQAQYLAARVQGHLALELLAPVSLNVVCFRFRRPDLAATTLDRLNGEIVEDLHESGIAAPSTTTIEGRKAIRVCLTNHRTQDSDLDRLLDAVLAIGARRAGDGIADGPRASGSPPQPASEAGEREPVAGPGARPELRALSQDVDLGLDPDLDLPFLVETGWRVRLGRSCAHDATFAAPLLHHALELALWQRLAGSEGAPVSPASDLLACRVGTLHLRSRGIGRVPDDPAIPEWLAAAYELAAGDAPPAASDLGRTECRVLIGSLARLRGAAPSDLGSIDAIERLHATLARWWWVAAPTEHLLTTGGDQRLVIDPGTGTNPYGGAPRPRPETLEFASSTASTISQPGFDAAENLRQSILRSAFTRDPHEVFDAAIERVRVRIAEATGIDPGGPVQIVLVPSGTDGELAALQLARGASGGGIVNLLMAPSETGRGVPEAAVGRHAGTRTPDGGSVEPGTAVADLGPGRITAPTIEIRDDDGRARPLGEIDREVEQLVETAVGDGNRCLLHLIDGSKSGLVAPSPALARRLRRRFPTRLDVLVDACQMRLGRSRIERHLDAGFMVLITGSKFFTGPPFSGALLIPEPLARRAADFAGLPPGFGRYFARAEWPAAWPSIRGSLPPRRNLGLLLRWQAALSEMDGFEAVAEAPRRQIVASLSEAARAAIEGSDHLSLVPPGRDPDGDPATIIAFQVRSSVGAAMDMAAIRRVYRWLADDVSAWLPTPCPPWARAVAATPCLVGQPIALGHHGAALRIGLGARLVSEVAFSPDLGDSLEGRLAAQIERLRIVIRKCELIARQFERLVSLADPDQVRPAARG